MTPPTGPRLRLAGDTITWEEFEQFVFSLCSRLPVIGSANRYGAPGDAQDGIDIELTFVDGRTGGLQVRQRKHFGKPDFDKAVKDNKYDANVHIVATSTVATAPARKAARAKKDWELWDIDDIGDKVRALPRVDARWLIEDLLGAQQRRDFLGPAGPLILARWPKHYERLLEPKRLFSHTLPLSGRGDTLAALDQFLDDPKQQVAVLAGRGGSGKSRVLLEFARRRDVDDRPIVFVSEGATITAQTLDDELPLGPAVLVIDDAHRNDGAREAIAYTARRHDVKLVLGTRPHKRDDLAAYVRQAGFDAGETTNLPDLEPLDDDDSTALAREALPGGEERIVSALGGMTRDCQLITVLAGRLLAKKAIPLGLLANESELRDEVLLRFRDELLGRVPETVAHDELRRLLEIVAGLQPIRDGFEDLIARIAEKLGREPYEIVRWLDDLEDAGLLFRVGTLRRITPDVLGDFVLEHASVTSRGTLTGFAQSLWDDFAAIDPSHLLLNLAELDWRVRSAQGSSTLLESTWTELRSKYQASDAFGRTELVKLLGPISIMQPERILELGEFELSDPAVDHIDSVFDIFWDTNTVKRELAHLIRAAGRHQAHTRRAMELLWTFGRDDDRPTANNLDHPLRLLAELGGYESGSLTFCDALLDVVEAALAAAGGYEAQAIDLTHSIMTREVLSTSAGPRRTYSFGSNFVSAEGTVEIRGRATALLRKAALAGGQQAGAAVKVIQNALRVPIGIGGVSVSQELIDQWRPEQDALLDLLEEILDADPEPSLASQIREVLEHEQQHSRWPECRDRAAAIREAHPLDLLSSLVDAFERPSFSLDASTTGDRVEASLAETVLAKASDAEAVAALLNDALDHVRRDRASPGAVIAEIARLDIDRARELLSRTFDHPDEPLVDHLAPIFHFGREDFPARLWAEPHLSLKRLAASALLRDTADLTADEIELLRTMVADSDPEIRGRAVAAIGQIARDDPDLAVSLAVSATPKNTNEVDRVLHAVDVAHCTDEQLLVFVGWLENADQLSWQAGTFITHVAPRVPERTVGMLIERARQDRDLVSTAQLQGLFSALSKESYATAVRTIMEAALERSLTWRLSMLAEPIARGDRLELITPLLEWASDSDEDRVYVACAFLDELPAGAVFTHGKLFAETLNAMGPEHRDRVRQALFAAATGGGRIRTFGVAAEADQTRRDLAAALSAEVPAGPGREFYAELTSAFERTIAEDLRTDDEEEAFGR